MSENVYVIFGLWNHVVSIFPHPNLILWCVYSPRTPPSLANHGWVVAWFLQGRNKIKMSDIIDLIYSHKHSAPSSRSTQSHEQHAPFLPSVSSSKIFHTHPSLFTWAINLVANHIHQEIYDLTSKDDNVHLRASTNGWCSDHVNLITWEALRKFSIAGLCKKYKTCAPVSWYLTESTTTSLKNGIVILKKRHPDPIASI